MAGITEELLREAALREEPTVVVVRPELSEEERNRLLERLRDLAGGISAGEE